MNQITEKEREFIENKLKMTTADLSCVLEDDIIF